MAPLTRRDFALGGAGLVVAGAANAAAPPPKPLPVAAVVTEYRTNSHADVIVGKILEGWRQDGGVGPALRLVSLYTDQVPKGDLSRALAKKHGFRLSPTVEDALTLGRDRVAVAGVLSIGEHGDYPYTKDTKQHQYPRRRFFDAIAATFRKFRAVVPVFNDKHLCYAWGDAKHVYDVSKDLGVPLLAGSSLPVAWRSPGLSLERGCELTQALALGYGGLESYGFHALETLQCMTERRRGGETGVAAVQAVSGDAIAEALKRKRWSRELLDAAVEVTAAPRKGRPKDIDKRATFFLIKYRDGLEAAVAMGTGLANEFAFAGQLRGEAKPRAAWFRLQEGKPFGHFAHLLRAIEYTVHTKTPAYPAERTLLTTGVLDALMHSVAGGGRLVETPELAVRYRPADWGFARGEPGR